MPALRLAPLLLAGIVALTSACSRRDPTSNPTSPAGTATADSVQTGRGVDAKLDTLLAEGWAAANVTPAPRVDDATFLRRATLDLAGRIPTPVEVERFTASTQPNKRRTTVDALLAGDDYAEHWSGVYADLLLAGRVKERAGIAEGTRIWLEGQLQQGAGYDRITTELLTAQGRFEGPGPYGFLISHGEKRNVEALAGKTAKVFLGLTLECAQCHDHPSDPRYAQEDFYALAAYFSRTKIRLDKSGSKKTPTIIDRPRGEQYMPTIEDPPGEHSGPRVAPGFLSRPANERTRDRRAALARAIIDSDLFAKTVVARTWERLIGRGLVPRWNDLGGERDERHPPILVHLATRFANEGHDLRTLLRTIVLSDAYQRASWSPVVDADPAHVEQTQAVFAQMPVRAMDADQLFRSLLLATGIDDARKGGFRNNARKRKKKALAEYRFVFSDDEMDSTEVFSGSVPQALLLLGGDLVHTGTSDVPGTTVHGVLDRYEAPADRVNALYRQVFGRLPTDTQRERTLRMLDEREHGSSAYEDLMHAMLLSSEFLTIH